MAEYHYVVSKDGSTVLTIPFEHMQTNQEIREAIKEQGENPDDYYSPPSADGKPGSYHVRSFL